jgi:DNA-directed RNA polymerase subunit RPC12/RpoP
MNDSCPHCRVVRDLLVKEKTTQKKNARGRITTVLIRNYSCGTCGSFVKSEEIGIRKKKS